MLEPIFIFFLCLLLYGVATYKIQGWNMPSSLPCSLIVLQLADTCSQAWEGCTWIPVVSLIPNLSSHYADACPPCSA